MSRVLKLSIAVVGLCAVAAWRPAERAAPDHLPPKTPANGWNQKTQAWEPCFGGVGPQCDGVNVAGLPFGAPVQHRADGAIAAYVSVGSILHDNCCLANGPNAVWCQNHEGGQRALNDQFGRNNEPCKAEWNKAVDNLTRGRQWRIWFGPYTDSHAGEDLTSAPARSAQIQANGRWVKWGGSETQSTRRLMAPAGTSLDKSDAAFCQSGRFKGTYWAPGQPDWGVCA